MSLSVSRVKDSAVALFLSLGRSFQRSVETVEKSVAEAGRRSHLRCVQGCVSRHSTAEGFPGPISACEISERIGSLPEKLRAPLQILMDDRVVLCFNTDKPTFARVLGGDTLRVMRQYPEFANRYWAEQLRLPRLEEYRIRNLNRLPAGVPFEGLQFISAKILKR